MKCYFCKKEITTATRTYIPSRNSKEKSKFRDLCNRCYREWMAAQGYILRDGIWRKVITDEKI